MLSTFFSIVDLVQIIVYHRAVVCLGPVAEWLCSGLQNRVHRFNSGPGLQRINVPAGAPSDAQANIIPTLSGFVDFSCADENWPEH